MAAQIAPRNPISLPPPGGHYSHGVIANDFVFVSGQLPVTSEGVKLVDSLFDEQVAQVLANVQPVLQTCGTSIDRRPTTSNAHFMWAFDVVVIDAKNCG